MDVLSGFQPRARASLADMAALLGFPGKLGFSGDKVWDEYLAGNIVGMRRYCETDVLNTYLMYLRFEFMRGQFTPERLAAELERVKALLRASAGAALRASSCVPGKRRLDARGAVGRDRNGRGRRAHA